MEPSALFRSAPTTLAPTSANRRAFAFPLPPAVPVTKARPPDSTAPPPPHQPRSPARGLRGLRPAQPRATPIAVLTTAGVIHLSAHHVKQTGRRNGGRVGRDDALMVR